LVAIASSSNGGHKLKARNSTERNAPPLFHRLVENQPGGTLSNRRTVILSARLIFH
jgi:hypothetical protein